MHKIKITLTVLSMITKVSKENLSQYTHQKNQIEITNIENLILFLRKLHLFLVILRATAIFRIAPYCTTYWRSFSNHLFMVVLLVFQSRRNITSWQFKAVYSPPTCLHTILKYPNQSRRLPNELTEEGTVGVNTRPYK